MDFKCLPNDQGVSISLNASSYFTFNTSTYLCIDLGNNNVRIERKLDGIREIVSTPASSFVRLDGSVISTTWAGLNEYLSQKTGSVTAGEGISIDNGKVSVVSGGPSTLGGFRVGNGLMVDGSGRLSATAVSEVTKVLATEADMLAQSTESLRPYRVIRLDTKRLYYLNAGESPAVLSNWFVGPSIEAAVVSFKGRTGVVDPEYADYNHDLVPVIDKTTGTSHKLVIDNGKLYVENISTQVRQELAVDGSVATLTTNLANLTEIVSSPSTGLVKKVADLQTEQSRLTNVVSNATTGLEKRTGALETTVATKANLVNGKVPSEELPPLGMSQADAQRLTAVEASAELANQKGDSAATNILAVDTRLTQVSNREAANNTATNGRVTTLDTRVTSLNNSRSAEIAALQTSKLDASTRGQANGIAPLDANGKVPLANLPAAAETPQWRVPTGRSVGTWYTNTSGNVMFLTLRTAESTDPSRFINVRTRANSTSSTFNQRSTAISVTSQKWIQLLAVVPPGWQYMVDTFGGSTTANTEFWQEMS